MAPRASIRAPTAASLPDDLRIPSNTPSLLKPLNRLSRSSLIDVALQWLDEKNIDLYPPYLARRGRIDRREGGEWEYNEDDDDETNPYPAARHAEEVRSVYEELRDQKGGKREVIDRILEGDWRQGLSLRQLATIDIRFIEDHPAGQQRWTALQLTRTSAKESTDREDLSASLPRFHASTFLRNLQREISPLVKAHYHISRLKSLPLTLLRIFVTDSPYRQPRQPSHTFLDASRIIYAAFPDSCPFIYTSLSSPASPATSSSSANNLTTNAKTLRMIVRDSIPKALSRPQERYSLQSTSLTAKSLQTLLSLRGPGRTNAANGIFSIFADAVVDSSPVDPRFTSLPSTSVDSEDKENSDKATRQTREASADIRQKRPLADSSNYSSQKNNNKDPQASKKRKLQTAAVSSRFGTTTSKTTAPLDRLQIHLQDPPRLDGEDNPEPAAYVDDDVHINTETPTSRTMTLTFSGTDVISGIRQLAECGIVDPERMPSWMTGEEGVSSAVIRGGRRRGRGGG